VIIRLASVLLLACGTPRVEPLSNRVQVSPRVDVSARTPLGGEYACSFFHYWPVTFGGCWWVR